MTKKILIHLARSALLAIAVLVLGNPVQCFAFGEQNYDGTIPIGTGVVDTKKTGTVYWETQGFWVTQGYVPAVGGNVSPASYNYNGNVNSYGATVADVPNTSDKDKLLYKDSEYVKPFPSEDALGHYTCTYEIDKTNLESLISDLGARSYKDSKDGKKKITLYFHTVFAIGPWGAVDGFNGGTNGDKGVTGPDGKTLMRGYYETLNSIIGAAGWNNKKDFADHFNMRADIEILPHHYAAIHYEGATGEWIGKPYANIPDTDSTPYYVVNDDVRIKPAYLPPTITYKSPSATKESKYYLFGLYWGKGTYIKDPDLRTDRYRMFYGPNSSVTANPKVDMFATDVTSAAYTTWVARAQSAATIMKQEGIVIYAKYKKLTDPPPITEITEDTPTGLINITDERENPSATGVIAADERGSEQFSVEDGIPTTESEYTQVDTKDYVSKSAFDNYTKEEVINITLKKTYTVVYTYTTYTYEKDKYGVVQKIPHTNTDRTPVQWEHTYPVKRKYSYWKIRYFDLHEAFESTISNYSLPGGSVTMPFGSAGKTVIYLVDNRRKKLDNLL